MDNNYRRCTSEASVTKLGARLQLTVVSDELEVK